MTMMIMRLIMRMMMMMMIEVRLGIRLTVRSNVRLILSYMFAVVESTVRRVRVPRFVWNSGPFVPGLYAISRRLSVVL